MCTPYTLVLVRTTTIIVHLALAWLLISSLHKELCEKFYIYIYNPTIAYILWKISHRLLLVVELLRINILARFSK